MDRDEARHILQLCRPDNAEDRNDPLIAEALDLLERDAELRVWFEEQQAFDAYFTSELKRVEPPAMLRDTILENFRMHQASPAVPELDNVPKFNEEDTAAQLWWRRRPWIGIAALFIVLFVIVAVPSTNRTQPLSVDPVATASVPDVVQFIASQLHDLKSWHFNREDNKVIPLQSYLKSIGAPAPLRIPGKLDAMPTIGCVTFDYKGSKLSMICFRHDGLYHLVTANKADLHGQVSDQPQVFELEDLAFKLWVEGDQVLILTVHGTKQDIPEII